MIQYRFWLFTHDRGLTYHELITDKFHLWTSIHRKELIEKGKKQVKNFSWEKTARETVTVLEEVAGGK